MPRVSNASSSAPASNASNSRMLLILGFVATVSTIMSTWSTFLLNWEKHRLAKEVAATNTNGDVASFNCVRQAVNTLVFGGDDGDSGVGDAQAPRAFSMAAIDSDGNGELSVAEKQAAITLAYSRLLKDCSLVRAPSVADALQDTRRGAVCKIYTFCT